MAHLSPPPGPSLLSSSASTSRAAFFNYLRINLYLAFNIGAKHGAVAQYVYQTRDTAGEMLNSVDRTFTEDRLAGTANLQPVPDVGAGFLAADRIKVVTCRHPLGQLTHVITRQQAPQLRLADQD